MDPDNAALLERIWADTWRTRTRGRPIIEVVAEFRRWIETGLRDRWFRPTDRMVRYFTGRRHEERLDEDDLSVTFETNGRRGRAEVLDVFVRCPALSDGRYGLRVSLRDEEERRREERRADPRRERLVEEVARLSAGLNADTASGDQLQALVDLTASPSDSADAMVYAMTWATDKPISPSKVGASALGAFLREESGCAGCKKTKPRDYTVVGEDGVGRKGYCRTCYLESLGPCRLCGSPIAETDITNTWSPKLDYNKASLDTRPVHNGCYLRMLDCTTWACRLMEICRVVANAVALRWAAALSTHSPAILAVQLPPLNGRVVRRLCVAHGYGSAHAESVDGQVAFSCSECRDHDELLERAVKFLASTMTLAAHLLWEHQVDDTSKRYMMLDRYGDETEPYRPTSEDLSRGARDEEMVDPAAIRWLLLEME